MTLTFDPEVFLQNEENFFLDFLKENLFCKILFYQIHKNQNKLVSSMIKNIFENKSIDDTEYLVLIRLITVIKTKIEKNINVVANEVSIIEKYTERFTRQFNDFITVFFTAYQDFDFDKKLEELLIGSLEKEEKEIKVVEEVKKEKKKKYKIWPIEALTDIIQSTCDFLETPSESLLKKTLWSRNILERIKDDSKSKYIKRSPRYNTVFCDDSFIERDIYITKDLVIKNNLLESVDFVFNRKVMYLEEYDGNPGIQRIKKNNRTREKTDPKRSSGEKLIWPEKLFSEKKEKSRKKKIDKWKTESVEIMDASTLYFNKYVKDLLENKEEINFYLDDDIGGLYTCVEIRDIKTPWNLSD